jgi:hypothetical protein
MHVQLSRTQIFTLTIYCTKFWPICKNGNGAITEKQVKLSKEQELGNAANGFVNLDSKIQGFKKSIRSGVLSLTSSLQRREAAGLEAVLE